MGRQEDIHEPLCKDVMVAEVDVLGSCANGLVILTARAVPTIAARVVDIHYLFTQTDGLWELRFWSRGPRRRLR